MNREIKSRSRVVQVFPSPESMLRLVGAVCAEQDEDWSSRRYISPESMLRLAEPAGPEPVESEASRRRGLMIIETAMELAGTGGGGRRDAMMQMDSGGGPFPNDGLHQLFDTTCTAASETYASTSSSTMSSSDAFGEIRRAICLCSRDAIRSWGQISACIETCSSLCSSGAASSRGLFLDGSKAKGSR